MTAGARMSACLSHNNEVNRDKPNDAMVRTRRNLMIDWDDDRGKDRNDCSLMMIKWKVTSWMMKAERDLMIE